MVLIKSKREIDGIRKSSQLAAATLQHVGKFVSAGVTTAYLDDLAARYIQGHGATSACLGYVGPYGVPFPKTTCISINNEVCHGIPSSRPLLDGDIVKIDITTILDGFYGDTCSTFAVGNISTQASNLIAATKQCLQIGIDQVKPGKRTGWIGYEINQFAYPRGFSVVYEYSGHGTGVRFHEEPQIMHISATDAGPAMRAGMTFTIEPMINVGHPKTVVSNDGWTALTRDGSLSAQFEHTILVTDSGYEILTLAGES
jgi:methionyl aminopeptidase